MQVKQNRCARGRIPHTRARRLTGEEWKVEQTRERSEDSVRPNTAAIERLNLRQPRTCKCLRLHDNFVRRHSPLRFGGGLRMPALQVGLNKRPLNLREIFSLAAATQTSRNVHRP